ncbi:MAG: toxin [Dehalococcoidia bacterium]
MIRRIQVMGPSGSGKSTLGLRLAEGLGVPHVELDAINWLPGWTERPREEFRAMLSEQTAEGWVVSGNYISRGSDEILWPRADLLVWLDLPLHVILPRQLTRSWHRWRTNELLWGTNHERFFPQLKFWDRNSLVGFTLATRAASRARLVEAMRDPRWARARWVRLTSQRAIDGFAASVLAEAGSAA